MKGLESQIEDGRYDLEETPIRKILSQGMTW